MMELQLGHSFSSVKSIGAVVNTLPAPSDMEKTFLKSEWQRVSVASIPAYFWAMGNRFEKISDLQKNEECF